METFTLKVIGFSRVFYEGEASQVQLPIQDGSMGIMAHHEAAVIRHCAGDDAAANAGRRVAIRRGGWRALPRWARIPYR